MNLGVDLGDAVGQIDLPPASISRSAVYTGHVAPDVEQRLLDNLQRQHKRIKK